MTKSTLELIIAAYRDGGGDFSTGLGEIFSSPLLYAVGLSLAGTFLLELKSTADGYPSHLPPLPPLLLPPPNPPPNPPLQASILHGDDHRVNGSGHRRSCCRARRAALLPGKSPTGLPKAPPQCSKMSPCSLHMLSFFSPFHTKRTTRSSRSGRGSSSWREISWRLAASLRWPTCGSAGWAPPPTRKRSRARAWCP